MTDPDDRYAALDARVAALEDQWRSAVLSKLDGLAYGINLVHQDVKAIRAQLDRQAEALATHGELLADVADDLDTEPARTDTT